jgi:hypothetical protein
MQTTEYQYNDGLHNGGRTPRLYLAKGGQAVRFSGQAIDGYCAIGSSSYTKDGKWSRTQYTLLLAPGVRPLYFLSALHGIWGDWFASWGEVATDLGLPVEAAQAIVRAEYARTADRLDEIDRFALAVEAQGAQTEMVIISFGAPTNRAIRDGYWEAPKSATASDGRVVTITPGTGPVGADWYHPTAMEPAGAQVVGVRHRPGMHGGYYSVEVAVPLLAEGTEPTSATTMPPASDSPSAGFRNPVME